MRSCAHRQAFDYGSYSFPAQFPFVFSPDGGSYAFACDDSGARPKEGYLNNLCLSRAGSPSAEIVARRGPLEAFGAYTPNAIQWSPDGRRIAFRKRNRDNAEVSDVSVVELTTRATKKAWGKVVSGLYRKWGRFCGAECEARWQSFERPLASNPRRPPLEVRLFLLERDRFRCWFCGRRVTETSAHIDHIKPWSRGGRRPNGGIRTHNLTRAGHVL